jgi:hypothetical protein
MPKTSRQLDRDITEALKKTPPRRKYVGQCDRVRRQSATNEEKWQAMMGCAEAVSAKTFLENVDISDLLEEDETAKQWIEDARRQDSSTGFYLSWWGTERAWFIQTAGFEFIFLD